MKKLISFLFYDTITIKVWRGAVTMFVEFLILWIIVLLNNSINFFTVNMILIIIVSFFLVKPQNKRL